MSQFFVVHPDNPQKRLLTQSAEILRRGGLVLYPTDSCYAFGCLVGATDAVERIRTIRQLDDRHHFTLACADLSAIATYAKLDNVAFRYVKPLIPGPYTFILPATKLVPRRLQHPKRKTIGIRIPGNNIAKELLEMLGEPIMTATVQLPNESEPMVDPYQMREELERRVDLIIDGGYGSVEATTIIDLVDGEPVVLREGKGPLPKW